MSFNQAMEKYIGEIEVALKGYIPNSDCIYSDVNDAIAYSLLDAGKRIRPILTLEFCRVCGGEVHMAMPFACAVEMIHTYSLIHDDLPCLDNDQLRRGKPSSHIKFGEDIALLAGDALQALAFETMLDNEKNSNLKPNLALKASLCLASAAGVNGMVGGQVIDIQSENKQISIQTLQQMDALKTGALIIAASKMGCIVAGAEEEKIIAAEKYAKNIGIAFQIVDDILDETSDTTTLGKPVKSDKDSNKSTYVSLFGIEEAKNQANYHTQEAKKALAVFGDKTEFLLELADFLAFRNH